MATRMDPPAAVLSEETTHQHPPQQQQRRRGARSVERTLLFAISYAILSILKLEPLARNSVQDHNSDIDLPSQLQSTPDTAFLPPATSLHDDEIHEIKNNLTSKTKFVAITDISYASIAVDWYQRLISLGYPASQIVVVAADDETVSYFNKINNNNNNTSIQVEPMLHPSSPGWPISHSSIPKQKRRRRIFASRWIYVLHQLKLGHSILLSDADNIFVRYVDTATFERSDTDVIHAYCYNFPVRFLSMGFVVCGGMMWLRGDGGVNGPAVKYVESILEQCQWDGLSKLREVDYTTNHSIHHHPPKLVTTAALCDDQQVINSKFFENTLNYRWDNNTRPNDGFWKQEASGKSLVTGHKFKFWNVDTAYRGHVDGSEELNKNKMSARNNNTIVGNGKKQCPDVNLSWVAMPDNTITSKQISDPSKDRVLRIKQWYEFCRYEKNVSNLEV